MDLKKIVPPPKRPKGKGSPKDWKVVERTLGMRLPDDYKELINLYGTGGFLEFLYLLSPFAANVNFNLLSDTTKRTLESYQSGREEFPKFSPPFHAYPHESGLFPWAITINGDTLFWLTKGKPNSWPVILCNSKLSEKYDRFNLSATGFLAQLMRGKIKSKVFPKDVLAGGSKFTPDTDDEV